MHTSRKQLYQVVHKLTLSLSPQGSEIRRVTLTINLEGSIEPRASQRGRRKGIDIQLLSGLDQCRQIRFVHLPSDQSTSANAVKDQGIPALNVWTVKPFVSVARWRRRSEISNRGGGGVVSPSS